MRAVHCISLRIFLVAFAGLLSVTCSLNGDDTLSGTQPLTMDRDIASEMIDGIDRFLLRQIEEAESKRGRYWKRDTSSWDAFEKSVEPNRERLKFMLGVRDERVSPITMQPVATLTDDGVIAESEQFQVIKVRWSVLDGVNGEGLLIEPKQQPLANVIVIPDVSETPEIVIFGKGDQPSYGIETLAAQPCRILVPAVTPRTIEQRGRAELTRREFLQRSSFELGRHLIGFEIQKVLAAVDWMHADSKELPIILGGLGEGAMLSFFAGAVDHRINAVCMKGFFGDRKRIWQEPVERNVFGLLLEFGDAEIATLIAPRQLVVSTHNFEPTTVSTRSGAPFQLRSQTPQAVSAEFSRIHTLTHTLNWNYLKRGDARTALFEMLQESFEELSAKRLRYPVISMSVPEELETLSKQRADRQFNEIRQFNERLLAESPYIREEFFQELNTSSLEAFDESQEKYRRIFKEEIIGYYDQPKLPVNPRTRQYKETDDWTAYEVMLDVFPDVFAYGVLLVPKDLRAQEQRPVVVCQHGLEGRPFETFEGNHRAYHDFAAKLCEKGYVVLAPQNPYIFRDRFRTLQRKSYPMGKTLFSIIVSQHEVITDWLASLSFVDEQRIAFYGLSYGGKTAMRVPALVDRYCLSICSADFNDWIWKNASTRAKYSYVWTGEYEIFEFNLGMTFNYSDMAMLIAPRPFMVERGHFDGVAPDDRVAAEFAKVRHLYQAKLGIGDRCEIEWFAGPHTINGKGTFEFLERHLKWDRE